MKSLYLYEKYRLSANSWNNILPNLNAWIVIWDQINPCPWKVLFHWLKIPHHNISHTIEWIQITISQAKSQISNYASKSFYGYSLWLPWKHRIILIDEKLRWSTPLNVIMLKTSQRTLRASSLNKVKQSSRQRVVTASIRMLKLMGCVIRKRC